MGAEFTNHLHLNSAEQSRLLCRLDQRSVAGKSAERRRHKRCEYRAEEIAMIVQHPGGGSGRFLVCARNISASGLSLIHGGYLHPGTECRLLLARADGSPMALSGEVIHCRHIGGHHHELGIRFLNEVDPYEILTPEQIEEAGGLVAERELPTLRGSILVVDESTTDRRLLVHHLKATGVDITPAATPGAALDAVRKHKFSLVLCDLNVKEKEPTRMIEQMRSYGVNCPIVVLTAETDLKILLRARSAGANEIIGKPYSLDALITVMAEWLEHTSIKDPIYSTVEDDPGMAELVIDFIEQARRLMLKLQKAIVAEDQAVVRQVCLAVQGSATGYGFGAATAAARDVLKTMDACDSLEESQVQLRRLESICARLSCTSAVRPARARSSDGRRV
ncbi:MAG: response regulator [Phycisphaerales bacterium]